MPKKPGTNGNLIDIDIVELVKKYGNKIKFSAGVKPMVTLEIGSNNERQILNDVTELLKVCQTCQRNPEPMAISVGNKKGE